eukprot:SAG31_NODE_2130_length_6384_cov_8.343994_2_plen_79_part_00
MILALIATTRKLDFLRHCHICSHSSSQTKTIARSTASLSHIKAFLNMMVLLGVIVIIINQSIGAHYEDHHGRAHTTTS